MSANVNPLIANVVCPSCGMWTEYDMLVHARKHTVTCDKCKATFSSTDNSANSRKAIINLQTKNAELWLALEAMLNDYKHLSGHKEALIIDAKEALKAQAKR